MRKQRGFSLIELLIVVAIILIIAAIAIPNLLRARIAANESRPRPAAFVPSTRVKLSTRITLDRTSLRLWLHSGRRLQLVAMVSCQPQLMPA